MCLQGRCHPGDDVSCGFSRPSAQIRELSLWEKVTVPLGWWLSTGASLPPRGHSTMSGDISGHPDLGRAAGTQRARDAAGHSAVLRTALHNREGSGPRRELCWGREPLQ